MKETMEFMPMYVLVSLFMAWLTLTSDPWSEYKFLITIIILGNGIFICLGMILSNILEAKKEKEEKHNVRKGKIDNKEDRSTEIYNNDNQSNCA